MAQVEKTRQFLVFSHLFVFITVQFQFAAGQSTLSTAFAVTFPPARGGSVDGLCTIQVSTTAVADVRITWLDGTYSTVAQPGETVFYQAPCEDRVTAGIESKVYYITASVPVSVVVSSDAGGGDVDASSPYALGTNFFTFIYNNAGSIPSTACGNLLGTGNFYTVSAQFENTMVNIYKRNPEFGNFTLLESFLLGPFQSYTNVTEVRYVNESLSGLFILGNRPVSVSSGSLCTSATINSAAIYGVSWTFLPPESTFRSGKHLTFQITTIINGDLIPNYYKVFVIASRDGTEVRSSDLSYPLNRGEIAEFQFLQTWDIIICTKSCLVIQVNQNSGDNSGIFTLKVPPVYAYDSIVQFTPASRTTTTPTHFARIISNSEVEPTDLILNNLEIEEDWACSTFPSSTPIRACHLLASVVDPTLPCNISTGLLSPAVFVAIATYISDVEGQGYGFTTGIKGDSFTSYANRFAVAFPPAKGDIKIGFCEIMVRAKVQSSFEISWFNGSQTEAVSPGEVYRYQAPCELMRTEVGIENKTYYVSSNSDLTVTAANIGTTTTDDMDATVVYPKLSYNREFYLLHYVEPSGQYNDCGDETNTGSFFVIMADQDETEVQIFAARTYNLVQTVILNEYQSYTNRTTVENNGFDFSGYYIRSSAPVWVSVGGACTHYSITADSHSGMTWSYMPPVEALREGIHISYLLDISGDDFTLIRVLSIWDGTTIEIGGGSFVRNRGEFAELELNSIWDSVDCSNPCLVVQLSKNTNINAAGSAIFMLVVHSVLDHNIDVQISIPPNVQYDYHFVGVVTAAADLDAITSEGIDTENSWICDDLTHISACTYIGATTAVDARVSSSDPNVRFSAVLFGPYAFGRGYGFSVGFNAGV